MQEDLKKEFIKWVEDKSSTPFEIESDYFLACLDESISEHLNTFINGKRLIESISKEESMKKIMQSWVSITEMMLKYPRIGFKNQIAPPDNVANSLLNRLKTLSMKCLS